MPIPILMYHNVSSKPQGMDYGGGLYVDRRTFARQMQVLSRLGYAGLSMSAAMPYFRNERQGRIAVITLDDGYVDNLENALPILQHHGFSATCYAVSDSVGSFNTWDAHELGVRKPLMDSAQLRAWRDGGMEVGAHTRTHPRLTQCDDRQLEDEIAGSKARLEDVMGEPVTQFCYPYGDHDARVVAAARAAGFAAAPTVIPGRVMPGTSLWQLPRLSVFGGQRLMQFALRLFTDIW